MFVVSFSIFVGLGKKTKKQKYRKRKEGKKSNLKLDCTLFNNYILYMYTSFQIYY